MISTDHQYGVTGDRLRRFEDLLLEVANLGGQERNPFASAHTAAVREQVESLRREMREYDLLRSGTVRVIEADTLADLPIALIKARIARGLSQSALAELLGAKQQLVQRWEAERFRGAALDTLTRIARVLNVRISERVDLSGEGPVPLAEVRRALVRLGFPKEVVRQRLIPFRVSSNDLTVHDELDARLRFLLGKGSRELVAQGAELASLPIHYKLPGGAEQTRTRAYSTYVAGICAMAAKCVAPSEEHLPRSWREMAAALFGNEEPELETAVQRLWDFGIPVVPMADAVAFHGACWRGSGRTVIVLKQGAKNSGRWLFDLLHETYHAVTETADDFMVIEGEESSAERRGSREERRADRFAAEAITGGRAEQLTDEVVATAGNAAQRLKSAVASVAARGRVPVGVLANLLAHRLAENGDLSWWPTAAAMQPQGENPWSVVRDVFLERADLGTLSRLESELLEQCLQTDCGDLTHE